MVQCSVVKGNGSCTNNIKWRVQWSTHIDELVQERRNPIALAIEFRLSCINPSILASPYRVWIVSDNVQSPP